MAMLQNNESQTRPTFLTIPLSDMEITCNYRESKVLRRISDDLEFLKSGAKHPKDTFSFN